jgi:hypothetical protein
MTPQLDAKLKDFYDIQQLIKTLETQNKNNRQEISDMVCVAQYNRHTGESSQDGWEYKGGQHICIIRPSIRHFIDKEQLPRDVYRMYGQLQEIITVSVSKIEEEQDQGEIGIHFEDVHCRYTPKRRTKKSAIPG